MVSSLAKARQGGIYTRILRARRVERVSENQGAGGEPRRTKIV